MSIDLGQLQLWIGYPKSGGIVVFDPVGYLFLE
jgi:hypothetical protein